MGEEMNVNVKSSDFTILYCLSREDFLNVLSEGEFKEDYEIYCMLRDRLVYDNNKHDLRQRCISCMENDHFISYCPLISYVPNKNFVLKKYTLSKNKDR